MRVTAQLYGQFLVSSQVNYTGTYLADHLDGLTHDNVRYFLKTQRFTPRQLWQQVRPEVALSARGYLVQRHGARQAPQPAHRTGPPPI